MPIRVSVKHIDRLKAFSSYCCCCCCKKKIQIDLVCLYPSIRSLKFQRFGVTQECSTAVQCLRINNEEQTQLSQELYPLCFSSHCPLLLTDKEKKNPAMMVPRHQRLDAIPATPGRTVPPGLLMCYQYFGRQIYAWPPWGAFCALQIQTQLFQLRLIALHIGFLKTPIAALQTLDLLAPVAPMANVPQQLLAELPFFSRQFSLFLSLSCCLSYRNRNHSSRGSASSSGLACCHSSPCEPRPDR